MQEKRAQHIVHVVDFKGFFNLKEQALQRARLRTAIKTTTDQGLFLINGLMLPTCSASTNALNNLLYLRLAKCASATPPCAQKLRLIHPVQRWRTVSA
ncbi:hypothetical protein [Pseudomonas parafulva]|uniref:hypothetical protein n=1 Tax=Pseudomonas parafulva TaxID=157782 RepID=UPI0012B5A0C6|nr:hypothetical protein [Pseudomonas parafulva]